MKKPQEMLQHHYVFIHVIYQIVALMYDQGALS